MQQGTQQDNTPSPFKLRAAEAMAGFSAACVLTLALISPPLNFAERLSTCLFSIALPMLVWARVGMDDEDNPKVLRFCREFRFYGHLLAVGGFGLLLAGVYWPACLVFGITGLATLIAWSSRVPLKTVAKAEPERFDSVRQIGGPSPSGGYSDQPKS